jgi:diguanylate cyclase (GGDEF)-like protein
METARQTGLSAFHHSTLDRIWLNMALLGVLAAPLSILRVSVTGWLPLYTYFIVIALLALGVAAMRQRLSYRLKLILLTVVLWAIGVPGMVTFGLLGAGVWWIVVSGMLVSILDSERNGLIVGGLAAAIIIGIASLFVSGVLVMPALDLESYTRSPSAWASLLASTTLMPMILMRVIGMHQKKMRDLMVELENQRDQISILATHDDLTGLPSRRLFSDRLQMAINASRRNGHRMAVLYIDVDDFKGLNDAHGHAVGDAGLQHVAQALRESIRENDTAARTGGDEFLVIISHLTDQESIDTILNRLLRGIRQPFEVNGLRLRLDVSIGVAICPDQSEDADELRRIADADMYRKKNSVREERKPISAFSG